MCMKTYQWSRLTQGKERIKMPSLEGSVGMFDCVLKDGELFQLIPYDRATQEEKVGQKCLVRGKAACLRGIKQAEAQVRRYTRPGRVCSAI